MRITLENRVFYSNNTFRYGRTMDRDRGNTIFVRFCVTYRIRLLYRKSVFEHAKGPENRRLNSVAYKKINQR